MAGWRSGTFDIVARTRGAVSFLAAHGPPPAPARLARRTYRAAGQGRLCDKTGDRGAGDPTEISPGQTHDAEAARAASGGPRAVAQAASGPSNNSLVSTGSACLTRKRAGAAQRNAPHMREGDIEPSGARDRRRRRAGATS